MKKIVLLFVLFMTCSPSFAWDDLNTRNTYNSYGSGYSGHNSRTGSNWNTNYTSSGQSGTNSRGENWSYNNSNGVYRNYSTGETRVHGRKVNW